MGRARTDSQKRFRIQLSAAGLMGKQSLRTTFRLPEHTIKLLNVVAHQLRLKQKSLFDQLMEDEDALKEAAEMTEKEQTQQDAGDRRPKTYVLSRKSLEILEKISSQYDVPRDLLVEFSIRRLVPVFETEQEKHKMRVIVLKDMKRHLNQGRKLYEKAEQLLGEDDAICAMIKKSNEVIENNVAELGSLIDQGMAMEDFPGMSGDAGDDEL
ncbi:MAG TPA: hypothetical protein DIT32_00340 [Peptococcaceae bacterium]|nr:hypothetical protein [Peptococcaceae bacterium]